MNSNLTRTALLGFIQQQYFYHLLDICLCIIVCFFPSGASLRVRTFCPKRRVGWHNSTVGLTLLEVWARSVLCVARGKSFKLFWPWVHLRQIPGFPQHPRGDWVSASLIPAYARQISMQTRLFCSCQRVHVSFPLFSQSTTLRCCRPAAVQPPSSSRSLQLYARVAAVVVADSLIGAWHLSPHHPPPSWCAAASDASQFHVHGSRQFRRDYGNLFDEN